MSLGAEPKEESWLLPQGLVPLACFEERMPSGEETPLHVPFPILQEPLACPLPTGCAVAILSEMVCSPIRSMRQDAGPAQYDDSRK